MKVKVIYDGPFDVDLDEKIREAMESIGMEWYAQGKATDSYRDICFEYDKDEVIYDGPFDVEIEKNFN